MRLRRRYVSGLIFFLGLSAVLLILFFRNYPGAFQSLNLRIVPQDEWPELVADPDDFKLQALRLALERNLVYLRKLPGERQIDYGVTSVRADKVLDAQKKLLDFLKQNPALPELKQFLQNKFSLLESASKSSLPWFSDEQPVLFTGYYVPTLRGSLKPDARYRFPLYRKPDDLVTIEIKQFNLQRRVRKLWPWLEGLPFGPQLSKLHFPELHGRLSANGRVVPYYTRTEIDYEGKLEGRNLELLWVDDDIDRFFLQIQGSGRVRLANGKIVMVGYSAANGQPYRSVGAWLVRQGLMRRAEVSMPAIRAWLEAHPERREDVFKFNPSYVFFRKLETPAALGCYQVPITADHSIATDRKVFPGGALALVVTEKPLFSAAGELTGWRPYNHLVLNQDTGGAIKGPYRVDLYCGDDKKAELTAGVMQQRGRLFIFVPR